MGLNLLIALEVANQYRDLCISVFKDDSSDKHGFLISRGPGHNFKPLLSTNACFENKQSVIEATGNLLEAIVRITKNEIGENSQDIPAAIINPGNQPLEKLDILNQERIEQIIKALKVENVANTWEMFPESSAVA